ncbi:hypothetical protein niasHT_022597 [Heterodera trifolii]|uniref:Uncharacterized protein n=1 Tax=Heterodera trifolii TaxID=157864 RepID=A0ABD2JR86_9BILA
MKSLEGRPVRPQFAEAVYGVVNQPQQLAPTAKPGESTSEMCRSALIQRRSANLPKLKELCAGSSSEMNNFSTECALASARNSQMDELNFHYADSDCYRSELAELYTYSEMDEFALNYECFIRYMREKKKEPIWHDLPTKEKSETLQNIVEAFENSDSEQRLEAARIILYILQGAYGDFADVEAKDFDRWSTEATTEEENGGKGLDAASKWFGDHGTGGFEQDCLVRGALNAYQVYEHGVFQPLCSLLRLEDAVPFERHADHSRQSSVSNSRSASHMDLATSNDGIGGGCVGTSGSASGTLERRRSRRSATLADNERIRVTINCIYHMVEAIRREDVLKMVEDFSHSLSEMPFSSKHFPLSFHSLHQQFLTELEEPMENKESLLVHLFEMMPSFVRGKTPHFPIKKILLLSWKVLLATLGGTDFLRKEKARKRAEAGLSPVTDTVQVAMKMKPLLNCDGSVGTGGFLGMNSASGGDGKAETDSGTITGQLGRKVRSIHHPIRPFNRQVACSSNPEQTHDEPNRREESNKTFPVDKKGEGGEAFGEMSEETKQIAEEVDEAIVGGRNQENEESEPLAEDENGALLDHVLEELSSASDEEIVEEKEERKWDEKKEFTSGTETQIKVTLTTSTAEETRGKSKRVTSPEQRRVAAMIQLLASPKIPCELLNDINQDGNQEAQNTDGGDQTPKACDSPSKLNGPWPPPPPTGLPWRPKVREADIESFLQAQRKKHFHFQLPPGDSTTVFALPEPIVRGSLPALRRNLYVPLTELQLKSEDRYNRFPFSQKEFIEDCPAERLYVRILPEMTEYVIALLKVILASLPSSKAKIDAVTILSDVLTPETDTNEVLSNSISLDLASFSHTNVLEETVRVAIDINRHKELIIKSASSLLILLLKHLRLNHTLQFENLARYLVLANCLPLVLKFLDQNICRYFQAKHELAPFNYPQCALFFVRNGYEWPQLTAENVDGCGGSSDSPSYFLWRNVFSSINLLRVINKLTKGKQSRTQMLVVYKSAPVLKRCMRAKLGIFQLYVLKLLKMQARYLGRQWRKTNMDLISGIYLRVRHRLNDDWAFANEVMRTKSIDSQQEENELGLAIRRFNARRYPYIYKDGGESHGVAREGEEQHQQHERVFSSATDAVKLGFVDEWDPKEWEPTDNSLQSALAWEPQFSERFTQNYEQWLEEEVFGQQTDWDSLLRNSRGLLDIYC